MWVPEVSATGLSLFQVLVQALEIYINLLVSGFLYTPKNY